MMGARRKRARALREQRRCAGVVTPEGKVRCPFCGGEVAWTTAPVMLAMHSLPPCATYLSTSPDRFLERVRIAIREQLN